MLGCTDGSSTPTPTDGFEWPVNTQGAVLDYTVLATSQYTRAAAAAVRLDTAVEDLLDDVSPSELRDTREAWGEAREPWLNAEVVRLVGGPSAEVEQRINAWPIDPTVLDFWEGENIGLTGEDELELTPENVAARHQEPDATDATLGFHVIGLLLYGPDTETTGPGERSHEAFDADDNIRKARRGMLLQSVATVLSSDLDTLKDQWETGPYASTFASTPEESFEAILTGMLLLTREEILERNVRGPFETGDPADEQSRFTDTTDQDIRAMLEGLNHVWSGSNRSVNGAGVGEVVENVDPALANSVNLQILEVIRLSERFEQPFDQEIALEDNEAGRARVQALIDGLEALDALLVEVFVAFQLPPP
jgi:uncharacterized iron-regulated protein